MWAQQHIAPHNVLLTLNLFNEWENQMEKTNYLFYGLCFICILISILVFPQEEYLIKLFLSLFFIIFVIFFEFYIRVEKENLKKVYFKILCLNLGILLVLNILKFVYQIKSNEVSTKTIFDIIVIFYFSFLTPLLFLLLIKFKLKILYVKITVILTVIIFCIIFFTKAFDQIYNAWKQVF